MDLGEIGCGDLGWTNLNQDKDQWRALVNIKHKMFGNS
jgi:hypothetical protein